MRNFSPDILPVRKVNPIFHNARNILKMLSIYRFARPFEMQSHTANTNSEQPIYLESAIAVNKPIKYLTMASTRDTAFLWCSTSVCLLRFQYFQNDLAENAWTTRPNWVLSIDMNFQIYISFHFIFLFSSTKRPKRRASYLYPCERCFTIQRRGGGGKCACGILGFSYDALALLDSVASLIFETGAAYVSDFGMCPLWQVIKMHGILDTQDRELHYVQQVWTRAQMCIHSMQNFTVYYVHFFVSFSHTLVTPWNFIGW